MANNRVRRYPTGEEGQPRARRKPGPKPGSPGARAIAVANKARMSDAALREHMRKLGQRGAAATRTRYGATEFYHLAGKLGGHTRWARARAAKAEEEG